VCATALVVAPFVASGIAAAAPAHVVLPVSPAIAALPAAPTTAEGRPYGWPLQPFDRPHLLRGSFGDPRFGAVQRNFHFGIDIPAADWTPVYAVASGRVYLEPDHVDVLTHVSAKREDGFSYWHIVAGVREHSFVYPHTLLGWVSPAWHHLHFAELRDGRWLNPLRPGALTPGAAPTAPQIHSLTIAPSAGLPGETPEHVDVIVDASAAPPVPPAAPWQDARFVPALIRWRLLSGSSPVSGWRTAVDFRYFIPPNPLFGEVYAPGTLPNQPGRPGHYLVYLARSWSLAGIPAGTYVIQAQAFGSRGAIATETAELEVSESGTAGGTPA
jgi:hypothetical protein